ncbi:uncharacterized protein LOC110508017 [Oncorhynchus mykiss]|uniref:uncharacterized protein LOC110508017 n=1 Tax=Oncorhynchus mykiss TaxID=8022 RepID=UPI0018783399|nr:uncharacterized protein LOC110508017 [Oncorhynchus mykiss]
MDPLYEKTFSGEHVSIKILKTKTLLRDHKYLHKNIPRYPENVEFHISKVSHVTNKAGLDGILPDGFKGGQRRGAFMWWDLNIDDIIITEAEKRYLDRQFPNRHSSSLQTEERQPQVSFLKKFTTSPVFQKGSRYGNFKFTFPLEDLMQMYTEQICEKMKPVLRVYETVVYKQEIMYAVVVHSPKETQFDKYPLLEGAEAMCSYREGTIVWNAQAVSETHNYELIIKANMIKAKKVKAGTHQFFVWDHVTLAFHMPHGTAIRVDRKDLIESLKACDSVEPLYRKADPVMSCETAAIIVDSHNVEKLALTSKQPNHGVL